MHTRRKNMERGFTLIEILVVIGMIAVLASIVLIAINPLRQFALAREAQRESDVNALLNAIGQRLADRHGVFEEPDSSDCPDSLPVGAQQISTPGANIRLCLVPTYISELPVDPSIGINRCTTVSCTEGQGAYDTKYTVAQDESGRVTVCAPGAVEPTIPESKPFCLTR